MKGAIALVCLLAGSVTDLSPCMLNCLAAAASRNAWVPKPDALLSRHPALALRGGEVMPPAALYANAVAIGEKKAAAAPATIFKLSVVSGAHIAFGALLALVVGANVANMKTLNPGLQKLFFGAFGLPFGLFMVLVAGGELFTGNVAMVSAAFFEGKASLEGLLKSWSISFIGNFIGTILVCKLIVAAGMLTVPAIATEIAVAKVAKPFLTTFLRGIVCNWMVCMAVWVASGCSTLGEKYLAMVLPVSAFVAFGAEHSIANMALIPLGMAGGAKVKWIDFLTKNLLPVTLGNIVGGALCQAAPYGSVYGTLGKKR
eukprot:TRINITY_DN16994_c0_g1_i4.p1 TRINITY_DN16994_c0_g1~~TRINITY_DN16994_c0_g1_i4.p1  ORF type:complete len:315 (-),score=99.57 TRINITY_DN16994_c0_g1_i4:262-1206(-)